MNVDNSDSKHDEDHAFEDKPDIYALSIQLTTSTRDAFKGASVDYSAQKTVIGHRQMQLYAEASEENLTLAISGTKCCLGIKCYPAHGLIKNRLPVSLTHFADIETEIMNIDIPVLLGLDAFSKFKIILDFEDNAMKLKCDNWELQIVQKLGHTYIEWAPSIFFTERKIQLINRHFSIRKPTV